MIVFTCSIGCLILLSIIYVDKRIPESISAIYYALGMRGWLFQLCMASVSLTLLPVWLSVSSEHTQWMAFLSCASLLFVAAAPSFRLEMEGRVHYCSAVVCCVCAVLWQILEGLWDVTLWFAFIGGMLTLTGRSKWCFWLECAVIASVYVNLWRII